MAGEATLVLDVISTLAIVVSLLLVARSNRRVAASYRVGTLQEMVSEMNSIRAVRAGDPDLERALFDSRSSWSDEQIRSNLLAVQLANILEWAYLARRDGMLDEDVWNSWVRTWKDVVLASEPLKKLFSETVWTFGRDPEVSSQLTSFVTGQTSSIRDPYRGI